MEGVRDVLSERNWAQKKHVVHDPCIWKSGAGEARAMNSGLVAARIWVGDWGVPASGVSLDDENVLELM